MRTLAILLLVYGFAPLPAASQAARKPAARPVPKAKPSAPDEAPLQPPAGLPADASRWMRSLTLRQQIAQLIVIPCFGENPNSRSADYANFSNLIENVGVGGVVVVNRVVNGVVKNAEPFEMAAFFNRMQKLARIPLIVGGDFERGASMRVANTTKFPHLMAYGAAGDLAATRLLGAATAREARALGVHWVFAPDADVNNNPENPIINTRSFGEAPGQVAGHVRAFIEGARSNPKNLVLVTAKHFPGHGDTAADSHIGLAKVTASRERLSQVELAPFRAAVDAGADAVMTAHLAVASVEPEEIPATVSKNVITGLLRQEIGFKGLVVTDAMDMQGLTKQFPSGEAAVRALDAGVDVLLMPAKPADVVQAVVRAIASGRLSKERVRESVAKMLAAKVRLGLHRQRLVDLEQIAEQIQSPEFAESAQGVAEAAVTLVRNPQGLVPLRAPSEACFIAMAENRYSQQGRKLVEAVQQRSGSARVLWLDPQLPRGELLETAASLQKTCGTLVVAPFVNASAYRGNVALLGAYPEFVQSLMKSGVPVILAAFGSPYLLKAFPDAAASIALCSSSIPSEIALVKALWGETGFRGKLPVSIPGFAQLGEGIQLGRRPAAIHGQDK